MSERKHALVTGGSRGIGSEIVKVLLSEGYEVWSLSRTTGEDAENLHYISCDMADRSSVEVALETVIKQAGSVDVLVNNAGITRDGLIMRMKDEAWDEVLAVNLTSVFLTCRRISGSWREPTQRLDHQHLQRRGNHGQWGQTNYAASKGGHHQFSDAARERCQPGMSASMSWLWLSIPP